MKPYERETYQPQGRKPYTRDEREKEIVLSLVSEKDADTIFGIIAWPIQWAGIILAALVLCVGLPMLLLAVLAWNLGFF